MIGLLKNGSLGISTQRRESMDIKKLAPWNWFKKEQV
jgi:hypothetical protein